MKRSILVFLMGALSLCIGMFAETTTPEWPDKSKCEAVAKTIAHGMSRTDVLALLSPFRPYELGSGGQGAGPQNSYYALSPRWALVVRYDLISPIGFSPIDTVGKGETTLMDIGIMGLSEKDFRTFQRRLSPVNDVLIYRISKIAAGQLQSFLQVPSSIANLVTVDQLRELVEAQPILPSEMLH